jgi:hypothetical protein
VGENYMTEKVKEIAEQLDKVLVSREEVNNMYQDMRGYMFDSLVFRFKDYQARAYAAEVQEEKYRRNLSEVEARIRVRDNHNRDLMRFIDILDKAMGEHN